MSGLLDVDQWLADLGLAEYSGVFRANDVDSCVLKDLTAGDLESIGVKSVGHRRKMLVAISKLANPVAEASVVNPAAAAVRGHDAERRQLTVMFVDLVGSTALSSQLDPEDMRSLLTAYQNAVAGAVTHFEGYVARYMGDGVLCYFGYPHAHEDDAERAIRAGLAICERVTAIPASPVAKLSARIGIATGLVVVGDLVGAGAVQEEAVVGDTPNLAARLQTLAESGQVVVASPTRRLVGQVFSFRDLGLLDLKGVFARTQAFAVLGERASESRFEARSSGAISPLIGREHELALMLERWNRAKSGEGQVVVLSGEAGIGKSRLSRAIIETISDEAHVRLSYQCSPYHIDSPLYPVVQQLTFASRFQEDDKNDDRLDWLERILVGPEADRPLFAALLGLEFVSRYGRLEFTPQQQRARTLDALARQLTAIAVNCPVFFALEDAHWIDPTTLELLDLCLDRVARSRVLMLITARPTFQHGFGGHPIVTKLALNRLERDQVATIVTCLTGGKTLPSELLDIIVEKTDGVPLFVEEITKTVLESGELEEKPSSFELTGPLSRLTIPSTLYDSLMARLDRLQPVKQVAQTAACIGRDFDYRVLKAIVPLDDVALQDALDRLSAAELIFKRGTPPDANYVFKHALVRDAAYENLLKTRRQSVHAKLVAVLKQEGAAAEILAQHAAAAGENELAIRSWLAAGESAVSRSANQEAASHFKAAIRLLESTPEVADRGALNLALHSALTFALMASLGYGSDEAGKVTAKTVELCRNIGDENALATALYQAWLFNYNRANLDEAFRIACELRDRMREADDRTARVIASAVMGLTLFARGEIGTALEECETAIRTDLTGEGVNVAYRYGGMDLGAPAALGYGAWCCAMLGKETEARQRRQHLLNRLEKTKHAFTLARGLSWASMVSAVLGDWGESATYAARAVSVAREYDLKLAGSSGRVMQSIASAAITRDGRFLTEAREAISAYRMTGARVQVPFLLSLIAGIALELEMPSIAQEAVTEALSLVDETGERQVAAQLMVLRHRLER